MRPITQLDYVDKIIVVRDSPGPSLPKVEYHYPPSLIAKFAIFSAVYRLFILVFLSLRNKPALIHAYLLFPHGILAFVAARLTRRPISISLIAGPIELYSLGSPLGIEYIHPLPWFGKVFLKILKHCSIVTTTGSRTRDFLVAHGVSKDRVYILPHTANDKQYQAIPVPKIYDIISVGRLSPIKHLEVLLKTTARVKEKYQNIRVGIVGDGPCIASLEKLSTELDICDNVEFLGFQKNVAHYYNSAKIFVLTSEREGFPSTFVEAMNCGIPSVVPDCGDIIDIAKDGSNAIIIRDYDDVDGFADAIMLLLEDKKLYRKLSQNALETAKRISVNKVAKEWNTIFKDLKIG
ncbi:glycosyltransferase [Chloroflexota bacterium]